MNFIEPYTDSIRLLCEQYHIASLDVFGSVLTDSFQADSDIDFLVCFEKIPIEQHADNLFEFTTPLSRLMSREVDVIEESVIQNHYLLKSINRHRASIYGRENSGLAA